MIEEHKPDYTKYTVYELYDVYFKIDKEKYPERFREITDEIKIRLNISETQIIDNDFIHNAFYNYQNNKTVLDLDNNPASRGERVEAVLLDSLITGTPIIILILIIGFNDYTDFIKENGIIAQLVALVGGQIIYLALNSNFLFKDGQSIGKKIVGIKIVTVDGHLPSIFNIYFKRYLSQLLIILIPFFGNLILLIDYSFVFRKDKRCLHDHFANTKVVKA